MDLHKKNRDKGTQNVDETDQPRRIERNGLFFAAASKSDYKCDLTTHLSGCGK